MMSIKKNIERLTVDKRDLQKRSVQIKKSLDEVQRVLGPGKEKRKDK